MSKKVVVTGGAGYIGSHTLVDLFLNGYEPIVVDNFSNSSIKNIEGVEELIQQKLKVYNLNCCDYSLFKEVFESEKNITALIHFAALKSVEESLKKPALYFDNNVKSLEIALALCKEYKVNNFVFSSSCTIYGQAKELPVVETTPFGKPESPYAETKQKCEEILKKDFVSSVSLRYFNPIGSHHSGLIGDRSRDNPANLLPIITRVAAKKQEKLLVFGGDYNTHDGTCVRDYIHVADLASSHVKSIQYLEENSGKHVFNIGTGFGYSVLDILKAFSESNNIEVPYEIVERRGGDIEQIYADTSLAQKKLKWSARTSLKTAVRDAWNWELMK